MSDNTSNPGASAAGAANAMTSAMDPMRLFAEMRLPAMPDMEALAQAQRRNMEALSAANRVALEGAQAVARRHMEILQQSMSDMTEAMRALSASGGDPGDKTARQTEAMKAAYERAVQNMKEIAELIQRSNSEALTVLNRRFAEAMEEVRTMVAKRGG